MAVDFRFRTAPMYRTISIRWEGAWSDAKIRGNFRRLERWATTQGLSGRLWIFRERGEGRWEVLLSISRRVRPPAPIQFRALPASKVASVTFDPDEVSPRVIYHGLNDWLRWRKKDKTIRAVGAYREVYTDDPWRNARAWAHTEIQAEVR